MELATLEKATMIGKQLEWAQRHLEKITAGDFDKTTVSIQSDKSEVVLNGRFFNRMQFFKEYKNALQQEIADLTTQLQTL